MQLLDTLPAPALPHPLFPKENPLTRQSMKAGTSVFRTGEPVGGVLYVASGLIKVFRTSKNGREIAVMHVMPDEVCALSIMCILTDDPYPTDAVVTEDSQVIILPKPEFLHLYGTSSRAQQFVAETLSKKAQELINKIEELAFLSIHERLELFLRTYHKRIENLAFVEMTHEEIARSLGTSREVVSRLLLIMEKEGDVHLERGRITLTGLLDTPAE